MYCQPETSYGDITRYYTEKGVLFYGKALIRPMLAQLLRNPAYVRADMDVYRFFRSQGTNIASDPGMFDGIHGCYLYQGRGADTDKLQNLRGHMLVVGLMRGWFLRKYGWAAGLSFWEIKQWWRTGRL